jgi:autotransporter-associated beta strand protein
MNAKPILRKFLLFSSATLLPVGTAGAQTNTWTGSTSSDFTVGTNWSLGTPDISSGTYATRIDINNGSNNPLYFTSAQGDVTFSGGLRSSSSSGGSMFITGGTWNSTASAQDFIGRNGAGTNTLTIDGGHYTNVNGGSTELLLLYGGGSKGVITIESGSLTAGNIRAGWNSSQVGTGEINLNGGLLSTGRISEVTGSAAGLVTSINFNGGTVQARGDHPDFIDLQVDNATVKSGGAKIDTNGFNITIGKALTAELIDDESTGGGLTKKGAGTLILSGANTFTGATNVTEGTLTLAATGSVADSASISVSTNSSMNVSALGAWTVGVSQTVGGSGTIVGHTILAGTLSPGQSPGTLTFDGDLTVNSGSNYFFEAGDLTVVTGTLDLSSDWKLTLGSGFQNGGSVTIFEYASLAGSAFTVPSFDIDDLGFTPEDELFLVDNGSEIVLQGVSVAVIPEPASTILGGLGLLLLLRRRR